MPPDYPSRLQALREELRQRKLSGFLVPMADEYQSEVVPPSARRIEYLSGFTGSAGLILLLGDKNLFFTDGRYTLQASQQLPKKLFIIIDTSQKTPSEWLKENASSRQRIGFDPWLQTANSLERYQKALAKTGAELVPVDNNPIDLLWKDRPPSPAAPIYAYDLAYAGQASADKRQQIAQELKNNNLNAAVIADPASVAWLLNVRGNDVPFAPLPLCMAILSNDGSVAWFVDSRKLTSGLETVLGSGIVRYAPSEMPSALKRLGEARCRVRVDPNEAPYWIMLALKEAGAEIDRGDNPCLLPKACKNRVELDGMRAAHRRDGAAMVRLLAWLDANAASGELTELAVEEKLLELRKAGSLFRGPSFATIAAAGANAALVHYKATEATNAPLRPDMFFLLDSGGQYMDGTTDITRTIVLGQPLAEMRDRFTRVLKGHIALAGIVFPEGTTGAELDVLARQYLWALGMDYNHGTGHGVGSYLCVHENPPSLSRRALTPFKVGMVITNEPGYYKAGHYGIRIENLQVVVERIDLSTDGHKMLGFEPLTLAPIDRRAIVMDMLTMPERLWLNDYHARVRQALRPLVEEPTASWLMEATEAI